MLLYNIIIFIDDDDPILLRQTRSAIEIFALALEDDGLLCNSTSPMNLLMQIIKSEKNKLEASLIEAALNECLKWREIVLSDAFSELFWNSNSDSSNVVLPSISPLNYLLQPIDYTKAQITFGSSVFYQDIRLKVGETLIWDFDLEAKKECNFYILSYNMENMLLSNNDFDDPYSFFDKNEDNIFPNHENLIDLLDFIHMEYKDNKIIIKEQPSFRYSTPLPYLILFHRIMNDNILNLSENINIINHYYKINYQIEYDMMNIVLNPCRYNNNGSSTKGTVPTKGTASTQNPMGSYRSSASMICRLIWDTKDSKMNLNFINYKILVAHESMLQVWSILSIN